MTEIPEEIHAIVASTSKRLRNKYRGHVEYEDVQQELYAWYLANVERVNGWVEEYDHPKSVERMVGKSLRNAGEKFCREEKAHHTGYAPEDEFFYSIPMVADLLTLYFDPDWMAPPGLDFSRPGGGKPPQEGWNLQAMVADVGRAYEALPAHDQNLLAYVYRDSIPRDAIASLALDWGVTQNAADHRVRRVVGRLREKLGGPRPYLEEVE